MRSWVALMFSQDPVTDARLRAIAMRSSWQPPDAFPADGRIWERKKNASFEKNPHHLFGTLLRFAFNRLSEILILKSNRSCETVSKELTRRLSAAFGGEPSAGNKWTACWRSLSKWSYSAITVLTMAGSMPMRRNLGCLDVPDGSKRVFLPLLMYLGPSTRRLLFSLTSVATSVMPYVWYATYSTACTSPPLCRMLVASVIRCLACTSWNWRAYRHEFGADHLWSCPW